MSTTRYNKYASLFGPTNDRRPRILLNVVEDQYNRDRSTLLDRVPKEIDSAFYRNNYGLRNGSVSAEFFKFLGDANNFIRINKQSIVNTIRTLGGLSPEPLQNVVSQLILDTMAPVDAAGAPIVNTMQLSNTVDITPALENILLAKIGASVDVGVIQGLMNAGSIPNSNDFSFKYDVHFVSSLLEEACDSTNVGPPSAKFFEDDDGADRVSRDYRDPSEKGCDPTMLAVDGKDGHMGAIDHLRKNFGSNCATTGVTSDGALTCQNYLQDCLQGKNIQECARYMQSPNFWKDAQKEVRTMNPLMIIKTLEAFQFPFVTDKDGLKRAVSPGEWLKNANGLSAVERVAIGSNSNLMGYLNMLVDRTNNSPAILNPSVGINGAPPSGNSRLNKMGIPHLMVRDGINKDLNQWINATRAQTYRVGGFIGIPNMFSGLTGTLVGGGYNNNLAEFTQRNSENYVGTADMFSKHVDALGQRLQRMGKQIHQGDLAKINQLIESLRNSERKLNKTMLYAEKYARLLESHGLKDNSAHVISMDHLKEFVDQRNKYFDRVSRRQTDLYAILTSIAEAVASKQ